MTRKLDIEYWTYERDAELVDRRFPNYHPNHHTGTYTHLWGGWRWTTPDGREYRTNGEGEGLWQWLHDDWKQSRGTMQFSLPKDRQQAIAELTRAGLKPRSLIPTPEERLHDDTA